MIKISAIGKIRKGNGKRIMKDGKITCLEWLKRAAWALFTLIIGYLLIASVYSTCYLGKYRYVIDEAGTTEINVEHTFFMPDHFLQHIIVFAVFSLLLVFVKAKAGRRTVDFLKKYKKYTVPVFSVLSGILAVAVVLASRYSPKFDQAHVVEIAAQLNRHDLSALEPGGYLCVFPFQLGIIIYYQLLSLLFGDLNYVAFQIVNAVLIAVSCYLLAKICGLLCREGQSRNYETGTAVLGLLFVPYLLYATFLYGTVVGMTLALLSVYTMLLHERNLKLPYLLVSALSIGIASVLKSNYQIIMIAQIIYLVFVCLRDRRTDRKRLIRRVLLVLAMVSCFALCSFGVNRYLKSLSAGESVEGIPMSAWVAMGLQDGKGAPGWYNGYNNAVFAENGFDHDKTQAAVKEEIKRIVKGYPKDITASISFFVKKVSSQWNNPTFQSLWILEGRQGKEGLDWLLSGNGRYLYIFFTNLLHTWILTGAFLYAVLRYKKSSFDEMVLPVAFIGGFLFHIVWEAEGLYAILYFPLLLPLSVCGYGEWRKLLIRKKEEVERDGWSSETGKRIKRKLLAGVLTVAVICAVSYTEPFAKMFARNDDSGRFDVYTQEMVDEESVSSAK